MKNGIGLFLDQLIKTLEVEQTVEPMLSRRVSGSSGGADTGSSEMGDSAARHGREMLSRGFTIEQVVHDYGDLCQAITGLAVELGEPIDTDEFRTLNRCLDNAIAEAVTEFNYQRDTDAVSHSDCACNERLGYFAHEARNLLQTATLSLAAVQSGAVGLSGATGAVLERSLKGLSSLVDRSLAEVRAKAGLPVQFQLYPLDQIITEAKSAAYLNADARKCKLTVSGVDASLALDVDGDMLFSAIGNLLQNAFKFTRPGAEVRLNAYASGDRIRIDVEDGCGGLPVSDPEHLFLPFTQNGEDRTGLGLGLSASRRSVEANGGTLKVRDLPGAGCVFTIDLPRHSIQNAPTVKGGPID